MKIKIDDYEFGKIIINGKTHTSDVIIYPDHIDSKWWRKEGHRLQIEDLSTALEWGPEVLIVGTGADGMVKITKEVQTYLKSKGIKLISAVTADACKKHNEMTGKRVVTALHLTC